MPEQRPQSPGPPTPARRWMRTIGGAAAALLLLVGGAIVNVAVAWLCAAFINPFEAQPVVTTTLHSATEQHFESSLRRFGHTRIDRVGVAVEPDEQTGELLSTFWTRPHLDQLSEDRAGWPLRSLTGFNLAEVIIKSGDMWTSISRSGRGSRYVDAIELSPFMGGAIGASWRALPLRPLWPGFIINTLFYALLLWLLFIAPFAARRMLRRRRGFRGLCEKCAYPIGTSEVCTECGAAVPRRVET